jgi:predicted HTH domain antitoxin
MSPAESLMLDAKQAILEEQHRRFQNLQREGRVQEAMQQFQVTLGCASDLLNDSLNVLEHLLAERQVTSARQLKESPPLS